MTPNIGGSPAKEPDKETYAIIGAAFEVHRILGCAFHEPVYQEALQREFTVQGIPYAREVPLPIVYKGFPLETHYRADFICFDSVVIELKAMERLTDREASQVINYLAASSLDRGILLNFGAVSLQVRRFVGSEYSRRSASIPSQTG